ncbi:tol-pal system YbgF family protein [Candidatus Bipolaricaulota bacterium]
MKQCQRIILMLSVSLLVATAASADVSIELDLANDTVGLGEPFGATIQLTNTGETTLVTRDDILSVFMLWPYLQLVRILPDGTEIPIASDRPLSSPSPSSLWVERAGVQVAVRPAAMILPGAAVEIRISNILRYLPIVDPGDYRLSLPLELPIYGETFTDPTFGETRLIAVYDSDDLAAGSGSSEFSLALSDGLTEEDVEWFRRGRESFLKVNSVADTVGAFAPPREEPPEYVLACSEYWIGEAYQRFRENDRAVEAYERVLSEYPESGFAPYAEDRLEEIGDSD